MARHGSICFLDWNTTCRTERVTVLDAATNAVLDTENITNFHNGVWAVWNVKRHVVVQVTPTAGGTSAVSGVFFH